MRAEWVQRRAEASRIGWEAVKPGSTGVPLQCAHSLPASSHPAPMAAHGQAINGGPMYPQCPNIEFLIAQKGGNVTAGDLIELLKILEAHYLNGETCWKMSYLITHNLQAKS